MTGSSAMASSSAAAAVAILVPVTAVDDRRPPRERPLGADRGPSIRPVSVVRPGGEPGRSPVPLTHVHVLLVGHYGVVFVVAVVLRVASPIHKDEGHVISGAGVT